MPIKIISDKDNVGVLPAAEGEIPAGHKVALTAIARGEEVIKYGRRIGRASRDIEKGEWVHSHNLRTALDEDTVYEYRPEKTLLPERKGTFRGYPRQGRRAGIRNDLYVIPTVGCVNGSANRIAAALGEIPRGIDGVYALTHQFGCSQLGGDHADFRKLLASVSQNPNAAGVLFVGLGCENNGIEGIKKQLEGLSDAHIRYMNCQDETDEVAAGAALLRELAEEFAAEREEIDLSQLALGLKCGGSDGFSGITANPLVGRISDRLIAAGGSAVLTEVPEMFGAEQSLMNRCADRGVFERFRDMIVRFKNFYTEQGFPVYENPSPGNRAGGITTLEEKSLGCVEKGGTANVSDVLGYADLLKKPGLSALDAPGNDLIAATALAASGCQIVLFTTGRGTPFSTFVPTLKISTNAALADKKGGWIDFDAWSGDEDGLWNKVLAVCGGQHCKAERDREIAYFKRGVTL